MVSKIEPGWQPKILKRGRAQGLAMNFSDFARENADNSPPQDRKAARRRLYRAGGRVVVWSVALFGKRDEEDAEGHAGSGINRRRDRHQRAGDPVEARSRRRCWTNHARQVEGTRPEDGENA